VTKIQDTLPESQIDMSDFLKEKDEAEIPAVEPEEPVNPTPAESAA
jgi:hypothetical protein